MYSQTLYRGKVFFPTYSKPLKRTEWNYKFGEFKGVTRGQGDKIPRAPRHYGGAKSLRGAPTNPDNVASLFFNTAHLLPKDLNFEHSGAKLASCPRHHLTSSRPWAGPQPEKNFRGAEVTFGNDYAVIDVQSNMMRLFCYDQLTNSGGGTFFIVGAMGVRRGGGKIGVFRPPGNLDTNQVCVENLNTTA